MHAAVDALEELELEAIEFEDGRDPSEFVHGRVTIRFVLEELLRDRERTCQQTVHVEVRQAKHRFALAHAVEVHQRHDEHSVGHGQELDKARDVRLERDGRPAQAEEQRVGPVRVACGAVAGTLSNVAHAQPRVVLHTGRLQNTRHARDQPLLALDR